MSKDWKGNSRALFATNGDSSHSELERVENDYYATPPQAVEMLLNLEHFNHRIWEPACGEGHISKVLVSHGYDVLSSDIADRNYGSIGDFLSIENIEWAGDIITNPPYSMATDFVEKSLSIIPDGNRVAMFLKLSFLEGKGRRYLFDSRQLKTVYVSRSRLNCGRNGVFTGTSAVCYCWFIWQKGFRGDPVIKWFN